MASHLSDASADIGLIGLAVMVSSDFWGIRVLPSDATDLCLQGQNLILNIADHGFTVCAYNRTTSKVDEFLANEAKGASPILKKRERSPD
jgi:6-phosphogluconate dehydrogenase